MRRFHEDFLWLDQSYQNLKLILSDLIGLCSFGTVHALKSVKNDEVNKITSVVFDKRALEIGTINELAIKYPNMGISYKVYYRNQEGSTSSTTVHVACNMVKENVDYDLCKLSRRQLLDNL